MYPDFFCNKDPYNFKYATYAISKQQRAHFPNVSCTPFAPFAFIHSDIWGPSKVPNLNGHRWFILFVDDHTRTSWVYLIKKKSPKPRKYLKISTN